jgi:hypothetical protein
MNPEQLAAIKARYEAASPGLWQFDDTYRVYNEFGIITMALALDNVVARADAAFISSAHQDVPALLAHAEALTARAARRERAEALLLQFVAECERFQLDAERYFKGLHDSVLDFLGADDWEGWR